MTCADVQSGLSLYLYGELDFASEEAIEDHLNECSFCQLALNREKEWHAAVNRQQQDVRPEWVASCRQDLHHRLASGQRSGWHIVRDTGHWLRGFFDFRTTERSYRLAGISFLVMMGFAAGRLTNLTQWHWTPDNTGIAASLLPSTGTRVQEIRPESGNRVRIILQQVQVREVLGSRDDDNVRTLLVGAARESADPGVRMDSVDMLAGQNGLEIRDAIVSAIKNDPSAAVRVKAIELLRQFPGDPVTLEALEFALAHDKDPGVRTEAMDVLVPVDGSFRVTPQLVKTVKELLEAAPDDEYFRLRCAQVLSAQAVSNGVH